MRFQDKTVFVATSGGSIGLAVAEAMQHQGAKVVLLDSCKEETAAQKESDTLKIVPVKVFYDETEMQQCMAQAESAFGAADVVVTALKSRPADFAWNEIPEQEAHRIFNEIMTGVQTVLKYSVPPMLERESGSIVVIGDMAGRTGVRGENIMTTAAYAGLGGLIRNMGTVFGKNSVTVNGVSVGEIEGEYQEPASLSALKPVLSIKGTGEDVANAVMYLADPAVFWNAGEIVDLNGGCFAV